MSKPPETLRIVIPLNIRKKNGRPKILPPDGLAAQQTRAQDPHVLRALGRSLGWRKCLDQGRASTIHDIASAEHLSDSYVARYLRLAYLSPEVLEALILQRRPSAVRVVDLVKIATQPWVEQVVAVFGDG
ncbi:MAG: hypothetical protein GXP05_11200 [Alphaproteobacteria bacterium]|nr:hypothetical protein [Alphaproteobacteria bacterium]